MEVSEELEGYGRSVLCCTEIMNSFPLHGIHEPLLAATSMLETSVSHTNHVLAALLHFLMLFVSFLVTCPVLNTR